MFGNKTYQLPLNRNYVRHWKMDNAVRELIQNALDSESPFVYEFSPCQLLEGGQGWSLMLRSEFAKLAPKTLMLGTTTKADDSDNIGSFGEGYKIALLVLTREGYDVEMHNDDVCWRPEFRHSKEFDDEILMIDETPLSDRTNKGLSVVVKGLTDNDREDVVNSCLLMQDNLGQIKQTPRGDILLDRPGMLYIGGLFICKTSMRFGYNVKPQFMKLERDRQTVSNWDLQKVTLAMWVDTGDFKVIAKMIGDNAPDVGYAQYDMPEIVRDEVYRQFRDNNPGAIVASSQSELKELVARGMKKVVYVSAGTYTAVTSHPSYAKDIPPPKEEPAEMLRQWFAKHSQCLTGDACKDWAQILFQAKFWEWK